MSIETKARAGFGPIRDYVKIKGKQIFKSLLELGHKTNRVGKQVVQTVSDIKNDTHKRFFNFMKKTISSLSSNQPDVFYQKVFPDSYTKLCKRVSSQKSESEYCKKLEKVVKQTNNYFYSEKVLNAGNNDDLFRAKRAYADYQTALFSRDVCKDVLGLRETTWKSSRSRKRKSIPLTPPKAKRRKIDHNIKEKFWQFLNSDEISKSGRRSVRVKDSQGNWTEQDVRHFVFSSKDHIYDLFIDELKKEGINRKDIPSKSALHKLVGEFRIFKPPNRETARCPHCLERERIVKMLNRLLLDGSSIKFKLHHSHSDAEYPNRSQWERFVDREHHQEFDEGLESLKSYDDHLKLNERVIEEQRKRRENHPLNLVTIVFDFKNSIPIGEAPVMTSSQMRKQSLVSCFGVTYEYRETFNGPLKRIYSLIISKTKDHDAYASIHLLRHSMKQPRIMEILKKRPFVEIKCDGASSNVNGELLHELFFVWPKEYPWMERISWCPYCRNHGKCICDTIFHHVDVFVNSAKTEKSVNTRNHVVQALKDGCKRSNKNKSPEKQLDIRPIAKDLNKTRGTWKYHVVVPNIQASCGITWWKDNDVIVNHLYPDVDRRIGRIEEKKQKKLRRKRVTVARYQDVVEEEIDIDIIERQAELREQISQNFVDSRGIRPNRRT